MAVYLTHYNPATSSEPTLDLQLDDHWFRMPPEEPFEVDSRFYADKLLEIYGPAYGLIELPVVRSRLGIQIDMEGAKVAGKKALKASYMRAVRHYVDTQLVDRVRKGLPALPPQGRAKVAIEELHIDLRKRYGFSPIDWDNEDTILNVPGAGVASPAPAPVDDTRINMLEAQLEKSNRIIALLAKQLGADLSELEDEALAEGIQAATKRKKKAAPTTEDQPTPETINV
jgi:hypothetical protein